MKSISLFRLIIISILILVVITLHNLDKKLEANNNKNLKRASLICPKMMHKKNK